MKSNSCPKLVPAPSPITNSDGARSQVEALNTPATVSASPAVPAATSTMPPWIRWRPSFETSPNDSPIPRIIPTTIGVSVSPAWIGEKCSPSWVNSETHRNNPPNAPKNASWTAIPLV